MTLLILALAVAVQTPDSVRAARWERALNATADSLARIRGAAIGFRLDLASASPDLVLTRAAQVRTSCRGADAPLREVERLFAEGVYSARARSAQRKLESGTVELRRVLARCEREWDVPEHPRVTDADSLRAWGPYRTAQLSAALRRYLDLVRSFMKEADLKKPAAG